MRALRPAALALVLVAASSAVHAEDDRQMVELPPMMQAHMMSNMRDHLRALDDILTALAKGDANRASEVAEARLGMSSLEAHGAAHMAPYMPEGMQAVGTDLHHAASRFAIAVKDAELDGGEAGARQVYQALSEISNACNACHSAYRIR